MPSGRTVGPSRVLALVYGFFVLAAGARSGVQIATKFDVAPLAYLLSAAAALVYTGGLVVFVAVERRPQRRIWAYYLCGIELAGVAAVGAASVLAPAAFPDSTVWSGFGSGYAYVPILLPVLALGWVAVAHAPSREYVCPDHRDREAPLRCDRSGAEQEESSWNGSSWTSGDRPRFPSTSTGSCTTR